MTVRELTEALSLTPFHLAQPDRPVSGGYAGDLLAHDHVQPECGRRGPHG